MWSYDRLDDLKIEEEYAENTWLLEVDDGVSKHVRVAQKILTHKQFVMLADKEHMETLPCSYELHATINNQ